jgi:hypothetical protein
VSFECFDWRYKSTSSLYTFTERKIQIENTFSEMLGTQTILEFSFTNFGINFTG